MVDRVRPLKMESPSEGGTQTDYGPTELNPKLDAVDVAGAYIQESTTADATVLIDRQSGLLRLGDQVQTAYLSGLAQHPIVGPLRSAYLQVVGPPYAPTSEIWWTDATMTKRIMAIDYGQTAPGSAFYPTPVTTRFYAANGTSVVQVVVDQISYSGAAITGITRTVS